MSGAYVRDLFGYRYLVRRSRSFFQYLCIISIDYRGGFLDYGFPHVGFRYPAFRGVADDVFHPGNFPLGIPDNIFLIYPASSASFSADLTAVCPAFPVLTR